MDNEKYYVERLCDHEVERPTVGVQNGESEWQTGEPSGEEETGGGEDEW